MGINPLKSHSISAAVLRGKSVPRSRPCFQLGGRSLPITCDEGAFKYLGHTVGASGILRPSLFNLSRWLPALGRAPLRPFQKFSLLVSHVIPRLLHGFQVPTLTAATLREADKLIKRFTKEVLRLNSHTPDYLLYAGVRDGGLGVPHLRSLVPAVYAGRINRMEATLAPWTDGLAQFQRFRERLDRLSSTANSNSFAAGLAASSFSGGLAGAKHDSSSRTWIRRPPSYWAGKDYVRAVQLRTLNLPTVGIMSNPADQRQCRAGCPRVESISHVLQGCALTHHLRIDRHNDLCRKLARHCRARGWTVEEEPHVRHPDGRLYKPDLVIHHSDRIATVCDVQVSWEGTRSLAASWEAKRQVYDNSHFLQAAATKWPGTFFSFTPLIVGARGVWPASNRITVDRLALGRGFREACITGVLRWGSTIHAGFMRAIWSRSQQRRPIPGNRPPNEAARPAQPITRSGPDP